MHSEPLNCFDYGDLRILELAYPAKLLTLNTSRIVWIAFDLLLPTCDTCNRKSLSWLPRLGDSPMGIYNFSINYCLAMGSIIVEIAKSFTRNLGLLDETG